MKSGMERFIGILLTGCCGAAAWADNARVQAMDEQGHNNLTSAYYRDYDPQELSEQPDFAGISADQDQSYRSESYLPASEPGLAHDQQLGTSQPDELDELLDNPATAEDDWPHERCAQEHEDLAAPAAEGVDHLPAGVPGRRSFNKPFTEPPAEPLGQPLGPLAPPVARKKEQWCAPWYASFAETKLGKLLHFGVRNTVDLNLNLFTTTSVKIILGTLPIYFAARKYDCDIQTPFYDPSCHKNLCQPPESWKLIADEGMVGVIAALISTGFLARDEEIRVTGQIYGIGVISACIVKDLVKQIPVDCSLRPWHENFSNVQRSHGGFPSGHSTEAAYTATLYWLRHGWKAGVPLGAYAAFIFGVSVGANRHYVSQVVAGASLGIMYGFAAARLIDCSCYQDITLSLGCNSQGGPAFGVTYEF